MSKRRMTKARVICRELTEQLNSGYFHSNDDFPSRADLIRKYHVAANTIDQVCSELIRQDLIVKDEKRRLIVRNRQNISEILSADLCFWIIANPLENHVLPHWQEWMISRLQSQFLSGGKHAVWFSDVDQKRQSTLPNRIAIELNEQRHSECDALHVSFEAAAPNTIFVDYRYCLERLLQHLLDRKIDFLCILGQSCGQLERVHAWFSAVGFYEQARRYGWSESDIESVGLDQLHKVLEKMAQSTRRCGILSMDSYCAYQFLQHQKSNSGQAVGFYHLVTLSKLPHETVFGDFIDLKSREILDKLLMLCARKLEDKQPTPPEIVIPELNCDASFGRK